MKKFATMAISTVLVGTMALGGSLAYLQDSDKDVNVMTLGNVQIEQIEQEWNDEGKLQPFTQAKPLLPMVGECAWKDGVNNDSGYEAKAYRQFDPTKASNVVDKYVTVKNTGRSDAYVRTIIALEMGDCSAANNFADYKVRVSTNAYNGAEFKFPETWIWTDDIVTTIDDKKYNIMVAVHEKALEPDETTIPSLLQVYMQPTANNEDCERIDGNDNGTFDILVLSQAVQAAGFKDQVDSNGTVTKKAAEVALDEAFGDVDADNVQKWFGGGEFKAPVAVATAEELKVALEAGGSVYLTEDVTVTATMNVAAGKDVVINLNGNDISYAVNNDGKAAAIINNAGTLEIKGEGKLTFVASDPDTQAIPGYATNTISNTGTLTISEGVTVYNGSEGGASYAVDNHGKFTLNGGTLDATRTALRVAKYNSPEVEFVMNSGTIQGSTPVWIQLPGSDSSVAPKISVTVNDGLVETTKPTSEGNNIFYTQTFGNSHANTSITINGGEFLGGTVSIGAGTYKGDAPTLTINGGTFEYNVVQWLDNNEVAVLYPANK